MINGKLSIANSCLLTLKNSNSLVVKIRCVITYLIIILRYTFLLVFNIIQKIEDYKKRLCIFFLFDLPFLICPYST